jgi:hypothetical protein
MSVRGRCYIYGTLLAALAVSVGMVSRSLFEFHWAIVSVLLLTILIVLIRSNRYQREWPMKRLPPNTAGATLVRSALAGQGGIVDERLRVAPDDRFKWLTQPMIVALLAVIAIGLLL